MFLFVNEATARRTWTAMRRAIRVAVATVTAADPVPVAATDPVPVAATAEASNHIQSAQGTVILSASTLAFTSSPKLRADSAATR